MRYYLFKVDDGARHTICAHDETEAFAVYAENLWGTGEWPQERPVVKQTDDQERVEIDTQTGFGKLAGRAIDWAELIGAPHYLACSEY